MTEPTPPQQTQQELYTQVSNTFTGMSSVIVGKDGAAGVRVTYQAGSGATATSMTATFSTAQPASEVAGYITAFRDEVTNAKNLLVVNENKAVAAAAGVAPLRVEQFTSSPAAVAAATRINSTPLVTAKGSVPQIAGESNTSYLARINLLRKVTGDRSDASIAAAVEFQRRTSDTQSAADAKDRSREAGARRIQSAGNALSAALVRIGTPVANAMRALTAQAMAKKGFRGRTGTQFANDRGLDPPTYIQIAAMPADVQSSADLRQASAIGMMYNNFFITDTQEMDAEKAEVSETFGAPHVFATGRYMRKVTIQGVCRTGAVNPDILSLSDKNVNPLTQMTEDAKARLVVPQTLGLRVLYDRVLRASEQISRSLFSRLVVDGEVYCGWFTTLNITRSGADEGFAHFTMSMLVFARYHKDEDWAATLLHSGSLPAKNAFDDSAASATMASMVGKMTLKVTPGTVSIGSVLSEGAKEPLIFKPTAKLEASGVAQPISTETTIITNDKSFPLPGLALYFGNSSADRVPLNGSTVTAGSFDLVPVVTDFAALRDAVMNSVEDAPTGRLNILANIRIKPTMGEEIVELGVNLQLNTIQTPEAKNLAVRLGTNQNDKPATSSHPAKEVFESNTTSKITARFNIFKANGSPLDVTNALTGAVVRLMHPTKPDDISTRGPVLTAKTGTIGAIEKVDVDAAAKDNAASVSVPLISPLVAEAGQVDVVATFDYSQLAGALDLRVTNPFASAKELETSFRYKIQLPGFNEFITPVISVTAQYEATWISKLLMKISGVKVTGEPGADKVAQLTFDLHPSIAAIYATKKDAVEAAINSIVSASTYEVEYTASFTPGFAWAHRTAYFADMTTAKVTGSTGTSAIVTVPGAAVDRDVSAPDAGGMYIKMIVPKGILQPAPFFIQK